MTIEEDLPELRTIGVLGAGQMGGGIAQVAAQAGFDVRLADASLELASKGRDKIGAQLGRLVDRAKMSEDMRDGILSRIQPIASSADFAGCDLVVEAATENFDLKVKLFKAIDDALAPEAFLASKLIPMLCEACFALQEGLGTPEDIDTGAKLGLNHPMGPFELADLIGLDTMLYIAEVLQREFGDDKYRPPTMLRNLVAAGWFGKKTGRGFYTYDDKGNKTGRAVQT
jgi:3-hydroxyacyl-CoA dehydrogenase